MLVAQPPQEWPDAPVRISLGVNGLEVPRERGLVVAGSAHARSMPRPKLVVRSFAISLDGFSAAPGQSLEAPFGKDGLKLMNWAWATKFINTLFGKPGGVEGIDNDFIAKSDDNIGG